MQVIKAIQKAATCKADGCGEYVGGGKYSGFCYQHRHLRPRGQTSIRAMTVHIPVSDSFDYRYMRTMPISLPAPPWE